MNEFNESILSLKMNVKSGQVWAIFDIDRVLINTTSWYRACVTPHLLIPKSNISKFIEINNSTYSKNPIMPKSTFRKRTLGLINRKITKEFINLLKKDTQAVNEFSLDEKVDEKYLYDAGYYIGSKLHIYQEAIQYLEYLSRFYGEDLHILYLTAGYQPFMQGVIDSIYKRKNLQYKNYQVFGSGIKFTEGRGQETFLCFGSTKRKVAETILNEGGKIVFACDDDKENESLLNIIDKNGGKTLFISHLGNNSVNDSWKRFVTENISMKKVTNELMESNESYSLYKGMQLEKDYPSLYNKFGKYINKIGIVVLHRKEYKTALENILSKISSENDKKELKKIYSEFIFEKRDAIYLRGKYYYHCLPEYIFVDPRTNCEKWYQQTIYCIKALSIFYNYKFLESWNEMNIEEKLLVLCIIDHYKNSIYTVVNTLYKTSTEHSDAISDDLLHNIDSIANKITSLYYELVFDSPNIIPLQELISLNNNNILEEIKKQMNMHQGNQPGIRELDDPYIISLSVLSTLEQMKMKKKYYDLIIDFPCGGLELGLAFLAISKIFNKKGKQPQVIHCFYSSKKRKRKRNKENIVNYKNNHKWLYQFVPKHHKEKIDEVINFNKQVLLYDNNVTTFSTLIEVKHFFMNKFFKKSDAVVAGVFYQNIAKYLIKEGHSEKVNSLWRKTLDFKPVSDYITAFNTWGTSEKGKMLESIFFIKEKVLTFDLKKNSPMKASPIFKVCRVQNIFDLMLAINNGGNMIGIHAVYPDRLKYQLSQRTYRPYYDNRILPFLPISSYECDSIQALAKYIPKNVRQVLLFEKETSIDSINQTINAYQLDTKNIYLQFQHRVNNDYIKMIKSNVTDNVIATIGAFQEDFTAYFQRLEKILNGKNDFILLDLSKHQPDLISSGDIYHNFDKIFLLKRLAISMKNNKVPLIIADDVSKEEFKEYLNILKGCQINVAGIDMQNNLEVSSNDQRYRLITDNGKRYQIRIRKSADKLDDIGKFVQSKEFRRLCELPNLSQDNI